MQKDFLAIHGNLKTELGTLPTAEMISHCVAIQQQSSIFFRLIHASLYRVFKMERNEVLRFSSQVFRCDLGEFSYFRRF